MAKIISFVLLALALCGCGQDSVDKKDANIKTNGNVIAKILLARLLLN